MKVKILLFIVFGVISISYSQTITIVDKVNKKPVEGVVLISEEPKASVATNVKGQADISLFELSNSIQVRSVGYETQVLSFNQLKSQKFEIQLELAPFNFDEVVVSGTRWRQNSGNLPSKIISISPREVELQNPQTAADLLGISGKVFIQKSQQGGGSPMIRGFATNRLIYTVDGVRMNTAIFRGGNIQNVISLDPFATQNTEVLFGPGSVIYGSDAVGGVMSFQTLTPQFSLSDDALVTGKAVTRYSSANNERTGHFDLNVGWRKWSILTSFSSWDYDHLRQGGNGPDDYIKNIFPQRQDSADVVITQEDPLLQIPSAYSQINLMQKVRFQPNNKWDIQYGFHYSETSPYGRYDRHNRYRDGTIRYAEWSYGPQKWMMNNFSIAHSSNNVIYDQMTLRLAQQSFEESRIDRSLNQTRRRRRVENVEAYSANLDFTKNIGKRNTFYYGVEFILNDVNSLGQETNIMTGITTLGAARYPNSSWRSAAVYLNDEWRITEKFTIQTGVRYNQYLLNADFNNNLDFYPFPFETAEINNAALTGSIGGVYRPNKKWAIRLNGGTAFRSPNVDDIGKVFDSEPGAVVVPNPNLAAEYAYNVDLGIARVFGDFLKIDVSGYYTILENAMVRRVFQINGQDSIMYDGDLSAVQAIQNAAVANVYGVQLGLEVKLPGGFEFLTDINYQYGEEEQDDGLVSTSRHAAPFFGVSRLRYNNNDLTLELNAQFQGERTFADLPISEQGKDEIYAKDINGNNYSPAWYTLNIKAMYQITDYLSLSGGIENITDQRYRPYSSGLSGAGRNFILSLKVQF
jgi:hemoglobin/transferrin/lactoferrin receptor protein